MKPPRFQYHAARTIEEAIELLARYAGEARILAGGQSLVPMLNFRLLEPRALIDIGRIPGLDAITGGPLVTLGAMTRQRSAEESPIVQTALPLLREALRWVGHLPTRSRGTIGGSIAHADPSAEIPLVLLASDGSVTVQGPQGTRDIAAVDLFESLFTTSLSPGELLTRVHMPAMPAGTRIGFDEFARRHGDFAIVAVALALTPSKDGSTSRANPQSGPRYAQVRLAASGVGSVPVRLRAAEAHLQQHGTEPASLAAAAELAAAAADPVGDANGSADYRRHLLKVLLERTLESTVRPTTERLAS